MVKISVTGMFEKPKFKLRPKPSGWLLVKEERSEVRTYDLVELANERVHKGERHFWYHYKFEWPYKDVGTPEQVLEAHRRAEARRLGMPALHEMQEALGLIDAFILRSTLMLSEADPRSTSTHLQFSMKEVEMLDTRLRGIIERLALHAGYDFSSWRPPSQATFQDVHGKPIHQNPTLHIRVYLFHLIASKSLLAHFMSQGS